MNLDKSKIMCNLLSISSDVINNEILRYMGCFSKIILKNTCTHLNLYVLIGSLDYIDGVNGVSALIRHPGINKEHIDYVISYFNIPSYMIRSIHVNEAIVDAFYMGKYDFSCNIHKYQTKNLLIYGSRNNYLTVYESLLERLIREVDPFDLVDILSEMLFCSSTTDDFDLIRNIIERKLIKPTRNKHIKKINSKSLDIGIASWMVNMGYSFEQISVECLIQNCGDIESIMKYFYLFADTCLSKQSVRIDETNEDILLISAARLGRSDICEYLRSEGIYDDTERFESVIYTHILYCDKAYDVISEFVDIGIDIVEGCTRHMTSKTFDVAADQRFTVRILDQLKNNGQLSAFDVNTIFKNSIIYGQIHIFEFILDNISLSDLDISSKIMIDYPSKININILKALIKLNFPLKKLHYRFRYNYIYGLRIGDLEYMRNNGCNIYYPKLKAMANNCDRNDIVIWCDKLNTSS